MEPVQGHSASKNLEFNVRSATQHSLHDAASQRTGCGERL